MAIITPTSRAIPLPATDAAAHADRPDFMGDFVGARILSGR